MQHQPQRDERVVVTGLRCDDDELALDDAVVPLSVDGAGAMAVVLGS